MCISYALVVLVVVECYQLVAGSIEVAFVYENQGNITNLIGDIPL
jgi:hypothetical protein